MKQLFLTALVLTSCTTLQDIRPYSRVEPNIIGMKNDIDELKRQAEVQKQTNREIAFQIAVDLCQTEYNTCRIDEEGDARICQSRLEACVVSIYRIFKKEKKNQEVLP